MYRNTLVLERNVNLRVVIKTHTGNRFDVMHSYIYR